MYLAHNLILCFVHTHSRCKRYSTGLLCFPIHPHVTGLDFISNLVCRVKFEASCGITTINNYNSIIIIKTSESTGQGRRAHSATSDHEMAAGRIPFSTVSYIRPTWLGARNDVPSPLSSGISYRRESSEENNEGGETFDPTKIKKKVVDVWNNVKYGKPQKNFILTI